MISSTLESDDSDLKKQRHISGGSHTYLLEEGETTVYLLSQPLVPTDMISIAAELRSLMLLEMAAVIKNQLPDIEKKIVNESTDTLSMEMCYGRRTLFSVLTIANFEKPPPKIYLCEPLQ